MKAPEDVPVVLIEAAKGLSSDDARIDEFKQWMDRWLEQAELAMEQWGKYQIELADHLGPDRVQIAEEAATPRLQAVVDEVKSALKRGG